MIDAAWFTSPPNKKKEQAASMELSNSVVLSAAQPHKTRRKNVGISIVNMLGLGLSPD
jgi:hypothetical protein